MKYSERYTSIINQCTGTELIVIQLTVLVDLVIVVSCCEKYYHHLETSDREVFENIMNQILLSVVLFMWIIELTTVQSSANGIN